MLATLALVSASLISQCPNGACAIPARPQFAAPTAVYRPAVLRYAVPVAPVYRYYAPQPVAVPVYQQAPVFSPLYSSPCARGACPR